MLTHVLVVRDPDGPTDITVEHDDESRINFIEIDLGASFDGRAPDNDEGVQWIVAHMGDLNGVPTTGRVYATAVAWLRSAARRVTGGEELIDRCVQIHRSGEEVAEGVESFLREPGGPRHDDA